MYNHCEISHKTSFINPLEIVAMQLEQEQEFIENTLQEGASHSGEECQQVKGTSSPTSGEFKVYLSSFDESKDPEEKIRKAIEFMRGRISLTVSPRFREFWEARKLCLPLFKEAISAKSRAELWQQYVDLSVEARRLKEILDEQSAFAFEQIDLAVQALVQDIASYETLLAQIPDLTILSESKSLEQRKDSYNQVQKELHFLNALAAKVNALRKEVIKTDMRVRSKNKLFEKLSECGDRIFPRRKELIKKISDEFSQDVLSFVGRYFASSEQVSTAPFHFLREEIKVLQSIAKVLTLNTHSFTETRLKLSNCWDVLKEWEKEKRKEVSEKKAQIQQNFDEAMVLVKGFEEFCSTETSMDLIDKKYQEITSSMREMQLGRFEVKTLKDQLDLAKKPHEDKKKAELEEIQQKEKRVEESRVQRVQEFRSALQLLLDESASMSFEDITAKRSSIEEEYKALASSKAEKALLDRMFKQLKDKVLEAKGRSLLSLSDDEQEQYEGLKQVLKEKKERRQEMKTQLEVYRKTIGGSSLDFEKAMACRDLLEAEKAGLEKINLDIEEIEGKIAELEG